MRHLALFLAALLLAVPVSAADQYDSAKNFGKTDCGRPVSCSVYSGLMSGDPKIAALVAQSDACVRKNFGVRGQESSFNSEMGLDSNRCLTSKSAPKGTGGMNITPRCCLVALDGDNCQLHCDALLLR